MELSIVLVILGLLVGGVLSGQSLIRAAELRAVSAEYQRYRAAVNSFRDKYFAIPGDMSNATQFWGVADGTNCSITSTGDARTCDGNGNGVLSYSYSGNPANEYFRFWQQLANAGLIEGAYSGIRYYLSTDGGESQQYDNMQRGYNVPASKLNNAAWGALAGSTLAAAGGYFNTSYGNNAFLMGGNLGYVWPQGGILKPEEAWNIDTKLDDGKPATGSVLTYYNTTCVSGAADRNDLVNGVYALSTSSSICILVFPSVF